MKKYDKQIKKTTIVISKISVSKVTIMSDQFEDREFKIVAFVVTIVS